MNKALYFLAIFLLVTPLSMAAADQGDWYISAAPVFFIDDPDRRLDQGVHGGQINAGYELTDQFFLEGHFGYHDIPGWPLEDITNGLIVLRENQEFLDIGFNVLANLNPDGRFSPYVIGGIGYLGTTTSITNADENRASFTGGFGLLWRMGYSRFSIRAEYRARFAYEEDFTYTDWLGSIGLTYSFGKKRAVPPVGNT